MQVEQLIYHIPIEFQADFLKLDNGVWTGFFTKYDFYLGKEVWTNSENPDFVTIVIHWRSLKEWKSIPLDQLQKNADDFDQKCQQKIGQIFKIQSSNNYKVYAPKIL
jgi:uncharacterized protein (TIGR03792 family)